MVRKSALDISRAVASIKPSTWKRAALGALCVLAIAFAYQRGRANGRSLEQLVQIGERKKVNADLIAASQTHVVELTKQELELAPVVVNTRKAAATARAKVRVNGDTLQTATQTVVVPELGELVRTTDARASADSAMAVVSAAKISALELLVVRYKQRTDLLERQIDVLERVKTPRCSAKCGAVIGIILGGGLVAIF